ncbi:MAG: alanyl-tRNA synthetase [Parcubacteria group bacterium Athens1014_10]|nr:MAG: alanyl-tRNA synthetase [Parcubacteria group bacterium Athens1014_10]TSD05965.1 MAG: alanyl-tRNA synthetase [Parcubacteria group bacterium Athens0714_12]
MSSKELRKIFLSFFEKRGHQIVPSSSLIPADPTALFTSAGMQQFVPYLSGETEPPYQRAVSTQKCFRTSDIDSVGNLRHLTFFEMLGNWSFGDYFKEEAIVFARDFITKEMKIPEQKLWITVFEGDKETPFDEESFKIWQKFVDEKRIVKLSRESNFWGPVTSSGPCGPCSEIHYDLGKKFKCGEDCHSPACKNKDCQRFIEIWNLVFMEYFQDADGKLKELPAKNVDTGMGLERLALIKQDKDDLFETDLFAPMIEKISELSEKKYQNNVKLFRIIADHSRAACFLISDGILPSKEDRGYVLRRILRRVIRYGKILNLPKNFLIPVAQAVIKNYQEAYPELKRKENDILVVLQDEEEKFNKTLEKGLKQFNNVTIKQFNNVISGEEVFHLYDTYGFPLELTKELAQEKGLKIDEKSFQDFFARHQEISRAGVKNKFGGHGLNGEIGKEEKYKITKLHTATHLLHQALRDVLGGHIQQAGSDLTPERLRFDFTHPEKLTDEQKKKIEEIVNQKIKEKLEIKTEEMPYEEAIKSGVLAFFKEKYPKIVKIYSIGDYSKEICAGPHIENTSEISYFKIISEKSSSAGVRRIKAIME